MLNKFPKFRAYIEQNFPSRRLLEERWLVVEGENVQALKSQNRIVSNEDGIFVNINGHLFRRYVYLPKYWIERNNKYPSYHIIECSVLQDIGTGWFSTGSKAKVSVYNRDTNITEEPQALDLCSRCRDEYIGDLVKTTNTIEFEENLEKSSPKRLRPDDYTWDWPEVSRKERKKKNYTCQNKKCKIQLEGADRIDMEVDHINGNKKDNTPNNLKVLCKLCHAMKDAHHKKMALSNTSRRRKLKRFLEKHGDKLIELENPHVQKAFRIIEEKES